MLTFGNVIFERVGRVPRLCGYETFDGRRLGVSAGVRALLPPWKSLALNRLTNPSMGGGGELVLGVELEPVVERGPRLLCAFGGAEEPCRCFSIPSVQYRWQILCVGVPGVS